MKSKQWPDNKKFALCLTHDVDRVRKTYQTITHFIKEKRFYHLKSVLSKNDPYWNFDRIMSIEDNYDVRSTFFFLNESKKINLTKPKSFKLSVGRYKIHESKIIEVIKELDSGGWEIGLHGSYESFKISELLANEKKDLENILRKPVFGIRQHYLNLDIPITWKIQQELGFKYDTTFSNQEVLGFPSEHPEPFKPLKNDFLVIPLILMDDHLFKKYSDLKAAWEKCENLITFAQKKRTVLTILWHQRVFNNNEFPGWAKLYEKIIKECKARDAWITTAKNITQWWFDNKY